MDEDGLIYLGAAMWLEKHGGGQIVRYAPQMVVPFAMALRQAFDPPAPTENKER
jgi:hypothetical protein